MTPQRKISVSREKLVKSSFCLEFFSNEESASLRLSFFFEFLANVLYLSFIFLVAGVKKSLPHTNQVENCYCSLGTIKHVIKEVLLNVGRNLILRNLSCFLFEDFIILTLLRINLHIKVIY